MNHGAVRLPEISPGNSSIAKNLTMDKYSNSLHMQSKPTGKFRNQNQEPLEEELDIEERDDV